MEERIKKYEKFVEKEIRAARVGEELFELHKEMLRNFQHERLVHLLIMLFFVFMTVGLLGITMGLMITGTMIPTLFFGTLGGLDLVMTILSIAYIKHYYFLENHIQGLYDLTEKVRRK